MILLFLRTRKGQEQHLHSFKITFKEFVAVELSRDERLFTPLPQLRSGMKF